tara:strand:- start:5682 stop:6530 length:849 start_codon:yes stop_codon:yes gene_type:complete
MPALEYTDPLDSRQFVIAIKRLADSLSYGTDRSPFLGSGLEYAQSRPYVPGDPVKTIDWRVTARTGVPHVKLYETPKQLPVWFILDTSASMTLSSTKLSKYQLAVQIAGGLALACLDRVSPVGLLAAGSRDLKVKPSLSRETLLLWLHQLRNFEFSEQTHLSKKLLALNPSLRERALVFVISDLHDLGAIPALKLLNAQHDLVVLLMRDPAEEGLGKAGYLRARDAESRRVVTAPSKHQFTSTRDKVSELQGASIDHFLVETHRPFLANFRLFLQSRNLLSR